MGTVIGLEWFTLVDQARTGRFFERFNGENGDTGLISVTERPYGDMIAEMVRTHEGLGDVLLGQRPPFQHNDSLFMLTTKQACRQDTATVARRPGNVARARPPPVHR